MIVRGLLLFTILDSNVLALSVKPAHLENEDVQVLKCIVEALADVLSRPHPLPVSQPCLDTLRTDDRLVSVLRHYNFLKELQEIAVKGSESDTNRDNAEQNLEEKQRSAFFLHDNATYGKEEKKEAQEEVEVKQGSVAASKRWSTSQQYETKRTEKERSLKDNGPTLKEVNSSEVKALQIKARRTPADTMLMEEEGSANRKEEDPEIESLAAIESELESVAQKIHKLRRG